MRCMAALRKKRAFGMQEPISAVRGEASVLSLAAS